MVTVGGIMILTQLAVITVHGIGVLLGVTDLVALIPMVMVQVTLQSWVLS